MVAVDMVAVIMEVMEVDITVAAITEVVDIMEVMVVDITVEDIMEVVTTMADITVKPKQKKYQKISNSPLDLPKYNLPTSSEE